VQDTLWVDNKGNNNCAGRTGSGTFTDPYCPLQFAIDRAFKFVRVFGSTAAYGPAQIGQKITIVGPTTGTSAVITGDNNNPAVTVTGNGAQATLDSLEVAGLFNAKDGVVCTNLTSGPVVLIRRSRIHNLGGQAVNANNCTVVLDRDLIANNAAGGILLNNSQYTITNTFIVANISTNAAVTFGPSTAPLSGGPGFSHNTVAGNGGPGTLGGIACNAGSPITLSNSIIFANTKLGSGAAATQLSGNCALSYVDIDDATLPAGTGNRNKQPDFVSTSPSSPDYHLSSRSQPNLDCCVNQIPPPDSVDHDYDGRTRPQPATATNYTIGAHEIP
jgi:hypothetical protein